MQIAYTDPRTVWCRVVRRRYQKVSSPVQGRNLATVKWRDQNNTWYATTRWSGGTNISQHSEREVWADITGRNGVNVAEVDWVYTELEPCGGQGGGCGAWLTNTLLGVAGNRTIYWTWPYPKSKYGGLIAEGYESGQTVNPGNSSDTGDLIRKASVQELKSFDAAVLSAYLTQNANPNNNQIKTQIHNDKGDLQYQGVTIELPPDPRGGNPHAW